MTVKELIKLLSTFPEDSEIYKSYYYISGSGIKYELDEINEVFFGRIDGKETLMID